MFNKDGRVQNTMRTSVAGVTLQIVSILLSFVYRTVFLIILDKSYLGINGLFSNILNILSMAELGIGTAIIYRLYAAVKMDDINRTAAIMAFYKKVYAMIALTIMILGLAVMPALKFFIKDMSEVPQDINIYLIYSLFLAQTVSSYLFMYKQTIMGADQRDFVVISVNIGTTVLKYASQILVLYLTRSFTFALVAAIVVPVVCNYLLSLYVTWKYKEVFAVKERLTKEEKKKIYKETGALMCHKIGGTVSVSIDSILLSTMIGIGSLGIYSNYSMIVSSIAMLTSQILGACNSSVGNLHFSDDLAYEKKTYFRMIYLNYWVIGFCAIALFCLLSPFIQVWLGADMLFDQSVVLVICVSFFISNARSINMSFINVCGLFVRDKARSLIEAGINLALSIVLVHYIGLIGIFIGTICSVLAASWWREPYLLFKHEFESSAKKYWLYYFCGIAITLLAGLATYYACKFLPITIGYLILRFVICAIVPNAIFLLITFKVPEFSYFAQLIKRLFCKIFRIKPKAKVDEGTSGN